jgi:2-polyprenyl-6-methoxyphenol hydroxylase-like FAD-dependent oxidoreductase
MLRTRRRNTDARLRSADWRRSWRTEITPERSRSAPLRNKAGTEVVLVGDAGYLKDLITAQGINEAFRDAERCAVALNECLTGARSFDQAMIDYQRDRDAKVLPMYEFTRQLASLEPPPPESSGFRRCKGDSACRTI